MKASPAPLLEKMQPVSVYGCTRCQKVHFEDTDGAIYTAHIYWQDKNGTQLFHETQEERRKRYGL